MYVIQHCFICRLSDYSVSEDAGNCCYFGIDSQTLFPLGYISSTTVVRLDLINTGLDLIHTRLDLIHNLLDLIHARLDLIQSTKIASTDF
jgi:hypothetical protein